MKTKPLTMEQINEAQWYARIWNKITSRPFTPRELDFGKAVASAVEASWQPIETAPRQREVHTIDIHGNQRIAYWTPWHLASARLASRTPDMKAIIAGYRAIGDWDADLLNALEHDWDAAVLRMKP